MQIDDNTNTNEQQNANAEVTSTDLGGENKVDDVFEKHINIAIEAQDGKAETPSGEAEGKESSAAGATGAAGGTGSGTDSTTQQSANKEGKKEGDGSPVRPRDLTLPDGTVVKGGAERRFYEQLQTSRARVQEMERTNQNLQQQLNQARQQVAQTEQSVQAVNGLQPQELAIAARMFRDIQSNPVGAVQKLLAELTAKGYKIDGIATGVDAAAIERIIDQRLGASLQTRQGPTDAEIEAEAHAEANQFFAKYPDARQHEHLIAKVMHDNPSVDLNTAYFSLRDSFAERGFDWSQPLEPQLQARASEQQNNQQQNNGTQQSVQQNGTQQPGLPSSRPATPASTTSANQTTVAHESTSMDDIIRESMREAGLKA